MAQWLLRYPLCIAIILFIVSLFRTKRKLAVTETVIEVSLACVSVGIITGMTMLGDYCVYSEGWLLKVCWWSFQAFAIVVLYHRRDSVAVDGLKWALQQVQGSADWVGDTVQTLRPTSAEFTPAVGGLGRFWQARTGGRRGSAMSDVSNGTVELAQFETGAFDLCRPCANSSSESKFPDEDARAAGDDSVMDVKDSGVAEAGGADADASVPQATVADAASGMPQTHGEMR
mmetsp:Transcript_146150/g.253070  ORF Transcript_146150/g.253070 Transcript_146150/m.253070 type:complete len:230 (+) Transcript_146150:3-692(+)